MPPSLRTKSLQIERTSKLSNIDKKPVYVIFINYALGYAFNFYNARKQCCAQYFYIKGSHKTTPTFSAPYYIGINKTPRLNEKTITKFIVGVSEDEFKQFKEKYSIPSIKCDILYVDNIQQYMYDNF